MNKCLNWFPNFRKKRKFSWRNICIHLTLQLKCWSLFCQALLNWLAEILTIGQRCQSKVLQDLFVPDLPLLQPHSKVPRLCEEWKGCVPCPESFPQRRRFGDCNNKSFRDKKVAYDVVLGSLGSDGRRALLGVGGLWCTVCDHGCIRSSSPAFVWNTQTGKVTRRQTGGQFHGRLASIFFLCLGKEIESSRRRSVRQIPFHRESQTSSDFVCFWPILSTNLCQILLFSCLLTFVAITNELWRAFWQSNLPSLLQQKSCFHWKGKESWKWISEKIWALIFAKTTSAPEQEGIRCQRNNTTTSTRLQDGNHGHYCSVLVSKMKATHGTEKSMVYSCCQEKDINNNRCNGQETTSSPKQTLIATRLSTAQVTRLLSLLLICSKLKLKLRFQDDPVCGVIISVNVLLPKFPLPVCCKRVSLSCVIFKATNNSATFN